MKKQVKQIIGIYLNNNGYVHKEYMYGIGYVLKDKDMEEECTSFTIVEWYDYSQIIFYEDFLRYTFQNECANNDYKKYTWVELKFNRELSGNYLKDPDKIRIAVLHHYYGKHGATVDEYSLNNSSTREQFNISDKMYNKIKKKALKDFVKYNTEDIDLKEYTRLNDMAKMTNKAFQ